MALSAADVQDFESGCRAPVLNLRITIRQGQILFYILIARFCPAGYGYEALIFTKQCKTKHLIRKQ